MVPIAGSAAEPIALKQDLARLRLDQRYHEITSGSLETRYTALAQPLENSDDKRIGGGRLLGREGIEKTLGEEP